MKSGYKVEWTTNALEELNETIKYLEKYFSEKELKKLAAKIESISYLLAQNPLLFSKSDSKNVHGVVILKFNTMYYRILGNNVQILSFFSNRQHPNKRKA